jgi:nucleotide-binding universal stress UspA family protein
VAKSLTPRAKFAFVHAIEAPARPAFLVAETLPAEALEIEARAEAMDRLRDITRGFDGDVSRLEVRVGRAADVVMQFATDVRGDLVVVGPHGDRSHRSLLLGTTADTLVRNATVPLLVGAPASGTTRVVAGVTDSAVTAGVLAWADLAARQLGGRLTTLYAIEPAAYAHAASMAAARSHGDAIVEWLAAEEERRRQALQWVTECSRQYIDTSRLDALAENGLAPDVILDYADRERAALIVLGKHESAPGLPSRLGSTVRRVLHDAKCAVLVIPPA